MGKTENKKEKNTGVYDNRLSEDEIKQLAEDIYRGSVFTDRDIGNNEDIRSVFMALAIMDGDTLEKFKRKEPGMIYEYMSNAGRMSVNGMPTFLSFRYIGLEDTKKVLEKYNKIKEAVDKI